MGYDEKLGICQFNLNRIKTNQQFFTFSSPATCKAIIEYLNERDNPYVVDKRNFNNMKVKYQVNSDDDYLFVSNRVPDKYLKSLDDEDRNLDDEDRKMGISAITTLYREIAVKSKTDAPKGKFNHIRSHKMRAYFSDTLKNEIGVDYRYVEFMLGHSLSGNDIAYESWSTDIIKKQYIQSLPTLELTEEVQVNVIDEETLSELKAQNEALKQQMDDYDIKFHEMGQSLENMVKYENVQHKSDADALRIHNAKLYKENLELKKLKAD